MEGTSVHRPRNVDWKRAGALLYGDWGTSKAYVIGLAFVFAGFSALPIILAVCVLTAIVGYNYIIICRHFPDGGGVFSAARTQSRLLAVMGALLLVANFTVTAAISAWAAMKYFGVSDDYVRPATICVIIIVGIINGFGPKHTGNLAMVMAVPMVLVVVAVIALSAPHLTLHNLHFPQMNRDTWLSFVGVILALSGVEAIANLTGVMKLDPGSSMDHPHVSKTARNSILPVAFEVVLGTSLLGWAMLSMPMSMEPQLKERSEDMIRFLAEHYGNLTFGPHFSALFGIVVGVVVAALLLSAVNTAMGALIGLSYMMARDGEMPTKFTRLNSHGVPKTPLRIAICLPIIVMLFSTNLKTLAGLYAIGVIGAITVNLGSCTFNKKLDFNLAERGFMLLTFLILIPIELTIAKTNPDALFFVCCVVGGGLALRAYSQRRAGLRTVTLTEQVAATVAPEISGEFRLNLSPGQSILVSTRGLTPVLRFAMEEARFRQGTLYVLYVKELAVTLPGPLENVERPRWQDDKDASKIMYNMLELGRQNNVSVLPIYVVSEDPAATILDLSATLGIDILMLGSSHRRTLAQMFKGHVANRVAKDLPENIQLIIHG